MSGPRSTAEFEVPLNDEHRVLMPFLVDPKVAFEIREVAAVHDLMVTKRDGNDGPTHSHEVPRHLRRSYAKVPKSVEDVTTTMAHLALLDEVGDECESYFRTKMEEALPDVFDDYTAEPTIGSATRQYQTVKVVTNHSAELSEKLFPDIQADPKLGYAMLKLFISSGLSRDDKLDLKAPEVLPFLIAAKLGQEPFKPTPAELMLEQLETGQYDSYIAEELLSYSGSQTGEAFESPNITTMLSLVSRVSQEIPADILRARLVEAIDAWPASATKEFEQSKDLLISRVIQEIRLVQDYAKQVGYVMPDDLKTTDHLRESLCDLVIASISPKAIGGVALITDNKALKRRIMARQRPPKEAAPATKESVPQREPAKVTVAIHEGGDNFSFSDESSRVGEMIEDFVSNYRGTPMLRENLEAMVNFIKTADLSQVIRGIKKYNGTATVNGSKVPIYGLKPSDAPGLSINSKIARHMRVLFVLNEGEIGLLALAERSKITTVERNLNLKG